MTTAAFETVRYETATFVAQCSSISRKTAVVIEASPKGVSVTLAGKPPFWMDGMVPRTAEQAESMAKMIFDHYNR